MDETIAVTQKLEIIDYISILRVWDYLLNIYAISISYRLMVVYAVFFFFVCVCVCVCGGGGGGGGGRFLTWFSFNLSMNK